MNYDATRYPKGGLADHEKLAYVTEPIIEKLKQDAKGLIDSGKLKAEGFANWAHRQLIEVLDRDPPDGLDDLDERDRRAIYDFVMGQVHGIEWKDSKFVISTTHPGLAADDVMIQRAGNCSVCGRPFHIHLNGLFCRGSTWTEP